MYNVILVLSFHFSVIGNYPLELCAIERSMKDVSQRSNKLLLTAQIFQTINTSSFIRFSNLGCHN